MSIELLNQLIDESRTIVEHGLKSNSFKQTNIREVLKQLQKKYDADSEVKNFISENQQIIKNLLCAIFNKNDSHIASILELYRKK